MKKWFSSLHPIIRAASLAIGILIAVIVLAFLAVNTWPALGAQGADLLRHIIGDKAVAGLEMKFNQMQDSLERLKYKLGLETPAAPWSVSRDPVIPAIFTPTMQSSPQFQATLALQPSPTPDELKITRSASTPTPSLWLPVALPPSGSTDGEGLWSAYIQDEADNTVAYRTFIQPDPERPYVLVAIVAIDLSRTRLHFVLGTSEPAGENSLPRSGAIPQADRQAGVLLAAFNGGFQARHGHSGAMANGIMALPPRDGFGTLVIYKGGTVSLAEWEPGTEITPNMLAFRQNGPLVVREGVINPRIYNNSPLDWGYTVNDVSPTVRTGIGLSKDGKTLYYFCGSGLSMEMLARAMLAAGAWNAIQLDINNYWALFVKFQPNGTTLVPEPLLPRLMIANLDRYLWDYSRDYFYLTGLAR